MFTLLIIQTTNSKLESLMLVGFKGQGLLEEVRITKGVIKVGGIRVVCNREATKQARLELRMEDLVGAPILIRQDQEVALLILQGEAIAHPQKKGEKALDGGVKIMWTRS